MTDTEGAAAPASEQAQAAPAADQQATPKDGVRDVDAAPENAENQARPDAQADGEQGKGEDEPKRLSRNQRLQRKAARLSTMVTEQAAKIEKLEAAASQSNEGAEPKEADFNGDYFAYQRALQKWDTKQLLNERLPQQPPAKQPDAREINLQEARQEFSELAEQLKASIPDFDQTVEAFEKSGGKFAPHVIEELLEIGEKGPLLAYQLAKTPSLAAELNAMTPRDAAREIGRLEAKSTLPERKTQTRAPAPLSTLRGGAAPSADLASLAKSDDASAYLAERRKKSA